MAEKLKRTILLIVKYIGLFHVAKFFYRKRIRILCYHGFSLRNEEQFAPGLFIKPEILDQRMKFLRDKGFNVITLDEAYEAVSTNNIADNSVVITIDDGFYSTYLKALPIFKKYNLPVTLYLTSYYFDKKCPIYPLTVDYMFWNTSKRQVNLANLGYKELANYTNVITHADDTVIYSEEVFELGLKMENNEQRIDLLRKLGEELDQDYDDLNESRILNLMNKKELKECVDSGMDIELHTHRHRFPNDSVIAEQEIIDNKQLINPYLKKPMSHFCYPSGIWVSELWPVLDKQNIKTSTTCDNGLITPETPYHAWSRFLDSARISQLNFESELYGFNEFTRKIRGN